jgi:hypothetical protein
MQFDFPRYDADDHLYGSEDALTRHRRGPLAA